MKKILSTVMALAIATITFTACEDVPEPYPQPTVKPQEEVVYTYEGQGTLESPYTVADAINYAKSFGQANSDKQVYIKGYITAITEEFSTQYGNASFDMSDTKEGGNKFTFYRGLYLGNKKFSSGKTQIKVDDEVIVYGTVVNYRGNTPETAQGEAYLYSLNGVTDGGNDEPAGEAKGDGTLQNPYNAAAAIAYAKQVGSGESDKEVYIAGKVSSIKEQFGTQYGNATFGISDDGKEAGEFTVFRALYLGNQKYTSGTTLTVGDEVVVYGKVTNYMGNTPETVQGKAYLYSLNGKTEAEGGSEPQPQPTTQLGTADAPISVASALEITKALNNNDKTETAYVKGTVTRVTKFYDQYHQIDYYIADAQGGEELMVYNGKNLGNTDFASIADLKVGDVVVVTGQLTNYNGTSEFARGNYLISLNESSGASGGGEEQPSGSGIGQVSGNTISVDFTAQGYDNAQDMGTVTLADGTTLTFDGGGNTNSPKYYSSGTAIRMYPKNTMAVTASKTIASIQLTCSANNAEGQISASPGNVATDGMTVNITGINSKTTQIANTHTGTGAASQLRFSSMVITYAE